MRKAPGNRQLGRRIAAADLWRHTSVGLTTRQYVTRSSTGGDAASVHAIDPSAHDTAGRTLSGQTP
jgi:hypothetical protein